MKDSYLLLGKNSCVNETRVKSKNLWGIFKWANIIAKSTEFADTFIRFFKLYRPQGVSGCLWRKAELNILDNLSNRCIFCSEKEPWLNSSVKVIKLWRVPRARLILGYFPWKISINWETPYIKNKEVCNRILPRSMETPQTALLSSSKFFVLFLFSGLRRFIFVLIKANNTA